MPLESLRVDGRSIDTTHVSHERETRESIAELFSRVVADGKGYAAAQVEVVKQTAVTGAEMGGAGVGMIVGAGFLAYAGLIVLLVAIFTWLADEIGPLGAGLVVTLGTLLVAFVLFKMGLTRIKAAAAVISGKQS